jgi:lipopolysaccharide biosynthesis glycosyltransferase
MRMSVLKLSFDKYFNAGILLMDLERIRQKHDIIREATAFFERFTLLCSLADQDFLNAAFKEDVLLIEEKFNRIKDPNHDIDDAVLHFAGTKPWQISRDSARDKFYWDTFMRSEWDEQLFDALRDLYGGRYMHRHSSDCIKYLVKRFLENFRSAFKVSLPRLLVLCRVTVSESIRGVRNSKTRND